MRKILTCAACAALATLAWGSPVPAQTTQSSAQKSASKKATPTAAKPGTAVKAPAATKPAPHPPSRTATAWTITPRASASRTAASRQPKKAPVPRTTWRNRQTVPSPERYKEIQEALVTKGYLRPEDAVGAWGDASTDALKRFQADQNLDSSGKINALSLIALGLGPKHDATAVPPKPAQQLPEAPAGR